MSDVMEKTLTSLPRLLSDALLGGGKGGQADASRQVSPPRAMQALHKAVDASQSRMEEAAIVRRELDSIRQLLEEPGASVDEWCQALPRVVYCCVLGYDVTFAGIYALKLAGQGKGQKKKLGYLAAALMMDPASDIAIMIMGTLHRDLQSSSILDNLMALSASAELVAAEHIPLILPAVMKLLRHREAVVRQKALSCVHAFFHRSPAVMQPTLPEVKRLLADRDPGVMSAVVSIMAPLVEQTPQEFVPLGTSFLSILQQVQGEKFHAMHRYHGVPLPWLQVKLVQVLSHLAVCSPPLTQRLQPALSNMLTRVNDREQISLAIVEESLAAVATLAKKFSPSPAGVATLARKHSSSLSGVSSSETTAQETSFSLWPNAISDFDRDLASLCDGDGNMGTAAKDRTTKQHSIFEPRGSTDQHPGLAESFLGEAGAKDQTIKSQSMFAPQEQHQPPAMMESLLAEASQCVSRFLKSGRPNLRLIGIKSLRDLVRVDPELAAGHQLDVVECLQDSDTHIRRQTLGLLQHVAAPGNVRAVCSQMLEQLYSPHVTPSLQEEVADMVSAIASRLAPDPSWFLHTCFPLLSLRLPPQLCQLLGDRMLEFFQRVAKDASFSEFRPELSSYVLSFVEQFVTKNDCSVKFAFMLLRFVPLSIGESVSEEKFLGTCSEVLRKKSEMSEQVLMCVQELLLRNDLDKQAVLLWVQSLQQSQGHSLLGNQRQKLEEITALAALHADLSSLSLQNSQQPTDFSLSFLDSFCLSDKSRPAFFKRLQASPSMAGSFEGADALARSAVVSGAWENSVSSASSQDSGRLQDDQPQPVNYTQTPLYTLPATKQVWTREGFAGDKREQDSTALSTVTPNKLGQKSDPHSSGMKEKAELAKALFQGLSPSASLVSSSSSCSWVHVTADADNTVVASSSLNSCSDKSVSVKSPTALSHPVEGAHCDKSDGKQSLTAISLPTEGAPSVGKSAGVLISSSLDSPVKAGNCEPSDGAVTTLPVTDFNRWKSLHASHTQSVRDQLADVGDTDQVSSPTIPSERVLSDPDSETSLCISCDSLEDVKELSRPVWDQSQASNNSELTDAQISCCLEAQMASYEQEQRDLTRRECVEQCREGLPESDAATSLYSGFNESDSERE